MKRNSLKRNSLSITFLIAVLAACSFSTPVWADFLYVDNGALINVYDLALTSPLPATFANVQAGAKITGMAVSYSTGSPRLLAAATGLSDIFSYSSDGATVYIPVANPVGLAVDSAGNVYTGANNGSKVEKFNSAGTLLSTIASGGGLSVQSLAVDGSGDLFYADNSTGNIVEHATNGTDHTIATNLSGSNFYGMVVDNSSNIFVSFWSPTIGGNNGIFEITPNGTVSTFFSAAPNVKPTGLAIDSGSGNLYMSYVTSTAGTSGGADVFTASGGILSATPGILAASGALDSTYGLAVVVPEPGTVLMLTGGLLSIALLRFRRSAPKA